MTKPTLVLDFDGVIHSYEKGWQDGVIYGQVIPGFFEWAEQAKQTFILAIHSSRSDSHKNIKPMMDWLAMQLQAWKWDKEALDKQVPNLEITDFQFYVRKPAAFVTIDDRAITFKGDWNVAELRPDNLIHFRSWTQDKGNE